jgi:methyltransferase (TIGR00027 family)
MDRSRIAGANAWFRAKESTRPAGDRILVDPWAERLAERDARVQAIRLGRFLLPALWLEIDRLQTAHCVRHRAIDALLSRAAAGGIRQVVVLGAGYDMRADRLAALAGTRVIELDQAAVLARKAAILDRAKTRTDVARLPVDLLREPIAPLLDRAGFDASAPACFVLEGLVHYLPRSRIDEVLAEIARGPARIVLSYITPSMYARATSRFVRLVRAVREVPETVFAPEALSARLGQRGFRGFRSWSLREQVEEFAPQAAGRRVDLSQEVAQADHDLS